MKTEHITPYEKEAKWTAFLNGEPDTEAPLPEDVDGFSDFEQTWELTGIAYSHEMADTDAAWQKINQKITAPHTRIIQYIHPVLRYAAVLLVVAGLAFAARYYFTVTPENIVPASQLIAVSTIAQPDNISTVTLPDGSIVQLNANTKLEYPEKFDQKIRVVKLSGEAFFKVAHNSQCPFVIETEGAAVEVLGTSFNVSAYPGNHTVEVNVATGKVRLTERIGESTEQAKAILPPGTSGRIDLVTGTITTNNHLSVNYLSWITKVIEFQRTPLAEAFSQLENIYHIDISYADETIAALPYTANFANNEIDYIMDVIARTHNLSVTKTGSSYLFARK